MKGLKKLLLCIVASVVLTTSIGSAFFFVNSIISLMPVYYLEKENKNDEENEELKEFFASYEVNFNDTIELMEKEKGKDYPNEGNLVYIIMMGRVYQFVQNYMNCLIIGISVGIFVNIIWIKRSAGKRLLVEAIIAILFTVALVYLINTVLDAGIYIFEDIESGYGVPLLFLGIFIGIYVINMAYQKITEKKLNKELVQHKKEQ